MDNLPVLKLFLSLLKQHGVCCVVLAWVLLTHTACSTTDARIKGNVSFDTAPKAEKSATTITGKP